jgi:hypothetical protein
MKRRWGEEEEAVMEQRRVESMASYLLTQIGAVVVAQRWRILREWNQ